jgi:hypothetical protein
MQLLQGSLYVCTDAEHWENLRLTCSGSYVDIGGQVSVREWQNNPRHYDNIFASLIVMFELLTLEDWNSIMFAAIDATDPEHGPTRGNNRTLGVLFIVYIVLGSFFVMNLFVGVIVTAYNEAKREGVLTLDAVKGKDHISAQKRRRNQQLIETHDHAVYAYHRTRNVQSRGWRAPFIKMVFHPAFDKVVMALIVSNVLCMCLEHGSWAQPGQAKWAAVVRQPLRKGQLSRVAPGMAPSLRLFMDISSEVFAYIFLAEMTIKMMALGLVKWYSDSWNIFDCVIVVTSMAEIVVTRFLVYELPIDPSVLRLFRIFRVPYPRQKSRPEY